MLEEQSVVVVDLVDRIKSVGREINTEEKILKTGIRGQAPHPAILLESAKTRLFAKSLMRQFAQIASICEVIMSLSSSIYMALSTPSASSYVCNI